MTRLRSAFTTGLLVGVSAFLLMGAAMVRSGGTLSSPNIVGGCLSWDSNVYLCRDAAGTLAQRNGTNAQTLNLYGTYTDSSNWERLEFITGGTHTIRPYASGTGTFRVLNIIGGNALGFGSGFQTTQWQISAQQNAFGYFIAVTDDTHSIGTITGNRPKQVWIAQGVHAAGVSHMGGAMVYGSHVVVIGDNGNGGTANNETIAGNKSLYLIECRDPQGCALTLGESFAGTTHPVGQMLRIASLSHANVTLADSGSAHLSAAWTGTPGSTISLMYIINRSGDGNWWEISRSVN